MLGTSPFQNFVRDWSTTLVMLPEDDVPDRERLGLGPGGGDWGSP